MIISTSLIPTNDHFGYVFFSVDGYSDGDFCWIWLTLARLSIQDALASAFFPMHYSSWSKMHWLGLILRPKCTSFSLCPRCTDLAPSFTQMLCYYPLFEMHWHGLCRRNSFKSWIKYLGLLYYWFEVSKYGFEKGVYLCICMIACLKNFSD